MVSEQRKRIATVGFRLWALASRFLLIFFLALYLSPSDVGLYGLIAATVAYAVYFLGLDIYTFTTRSIIQAQPVSWRNKVCSHNIFLLIVLAVVSPILLGLFFLGLLPWEVAVWFYLILWSEHWGMEIDRLLVAMSNQFAASLIILIRQAALPTILIPLLFFVPATRSIELVFFGWSFFNVMAVLVGMYLVRKTAPAGPTHGVDWEWILRGSLVALPFLIGTLCLRLMFTADRQLVAIFSGLEVLGAYTLAMTVAGGVSSLISVGVHQFTYPRLVLSAGMQDLIQFRSVLSKLWRQTAIIVCVSFIVVVLFHQWVLSFLDDEVYQAFGWVMPAAVGAVGVYNLSLVPHNALYALHADRAILAITAISTAIYIIIVFMMLLLGVDAVNSVLLGLFVASCCLVLGKYGAYLYLVRRLDW